MLKVACLEDDRSFEYEPLLRWEAGLPGDNKLTVRRSESLKRVMTLFRKRKG